MSSTSPNHFDFLVSILSKMASGQGGADLQADLVAALASEKKIATHKKEDKAMANVSGGLAVTDIETTAAQEPAIKPVVSDRMRSLAEIQDQEEPAFHKVQPILRALNAASETSFLDDLSILVDGLQAKIPPASELSADQWQDPEIHKTYLSAAKLTIRKAFSGTRRFQLYSPVEAEWFVDAISERVLALAISELEDGREKCFI